MQIDQLTQMLSLIREIQGISGKALRLTDFNDKRQALSETVEAYQELKNKNPDGARRLQNARLIGMLLGVGYRELREFNDDFLQDYVLPTIEQNSLLKPHLPYLCGSGKQDQHEIPGLDLLSNEGGKPDFSPLLEVLAKTANQSEIKLPTKEGEVTRERETVVDALRTMLDEAAEESKTDKKSEGRLTRPLQLLREADRRLKRVQEAYAAVRKAPDFNHRDFQDLVGKIERHAEALRGVIKEHE